MSCYFSDSGQVKMTVGLTRKNQMKDLQMLNSCFKVCMSQNLFPFRVLKKSSVMRPLRPEVCYLVWVFVVEGGFQEGSMVFILPFI